MSTFHDITLLIFVIVIHQKSIAVPLDNVVINLNIRDEMKTNTGNDMENKIKHDDSNGYNDYGGYSTDEVYQLYNIEVRNHDEAEKLKNLENEDDDLDFWSGVRVGGAGADVMVSPKKIGQFREWIRKNGMNSTVKIGDVLQLVEDQRMSSEDYASSGSDTMDWFDYHSGEVIDDWLEKLARNCSYCSIENIGRSHEGEEMKVLKVCRGKCKNKPGILIDAGIHAREWISPAVGTWILNELVTNDENHPQLTRDLAWYFLPLLNPDGYKKSRDSRDPKNRLWRKTTTKYPEDKCRGTDLNRNWDFAWTMDGASNDSCSETYRGPTPFSEVEGRNFRDFILKENQNHHIKLYLSLHSYVQAFLSSFSYTEKPPPEYAAMVKLGEMGARAIKGVHGYTYEVGCSPCVIGRLASGSSKDWALMKAGIPYAYTLELRGHDYQFLLPREQIIPNAEEIWAFIDLAGNEMVREFGKET